MAEKKPAALTDSDWDVVLHFDRVVDEVLASNDKKRISMLYSKMRYPMLALVEWEQRYNQRLMRSRKEGDG